MEQLWCESGLQAQQDVTGTARLLPRPHKSVADIQDHGSSLATSRPHFRRKPPLWAEDCSHSYALTAVWCH